MFQILCSTASSKISKLVWKAKECIFSIFSF